MLRSRFRCQQVLRSCSHTAHSWFRYHQTFWITQAAWAHSRSTIKISMLHMVTESKPPRCWEARGMPKTEQNKLSAGNFKSIDRDLTIYVNNWKLMEERLRWVPFINRYCSLAHSRWVLRFLSFDRAQCGPSGTELCDLLSTLRGGPLRGASSSKRGRFR